MDTSGHRRRLGAGRQPRLLDRFDPSNPRAFWESGIYGAFGIYKTADGGATFHKLGTITHNDQVSVDLTDPEHRTLLAGGHEAGQTLHLSTDGGETWTNIGLNLPPGIGSSTNPIVLNSRIFLVNGYNPGNRFAGVYRSINGGDSWKQVSTGSPNGPALITARGTIYWPEAGGMLTSSDMGLTWRRVGNNLRFVEPVELPDGRVVAVGEKSLVMTGDGGVTWVPFGPALPYAPNGLTYSPQRKAFFIWRGDCVEQVRGDAIMRFDFDPAAARSSRSAAK